MACMYAAVFTSEWMDLQLHVRYADLCTTWCYSVDIYLPCRTSMQSYEDMHDIVAACWRACAAGN